MTYHDTEIKTVLEEIKENRIYLPAIQRKLVWDHEQIEKLFDSIMRGFPIGTFLFWKLKGKAVNNYTFYQFLQEYKKGKTKNQVAPQPETRDEIIGILDGQQRLNSMYIAFQGSYAYKKPYVRWDNPNAFPKRHFFLNSLYSKEEPEFYICWNCDYDKLPPEDSKCPKCDEWNTVEEPLDVEYEFKFLTDDEKEVIDEENFWFPVKEVLLWDNVNDIDDYFEECIEKYPELLKIFKDKKKKRLFKRNLSTLWERILKDKLISYFEIVEEDLDKILDIFVRVNSAGTELSKTDLLFSTIVAHWEDGRDEIEMLIETINSKGDGFKFNNDFIMRTCLVLTDSPVLFKVETFKKENIRKITDGWPKIKNSIDKTVDLLIEFGLNGDSLTSQMAVIPIAYFFMKKEEGYKINEKNKKLLKNYIFISLLKRIYGSQGDRVLGSIRNALRKEEKNGKKISYVLAYDDFPLDEIKQTDLGLNKSFEFTDDDIEEILEYKKGAYTFMVLSFLYPQLKFGQVKFHQDHLHPKSSFTYTKLNKLGISPDNIADWQEKKDRIPNLQLLKGLENESKSKTPLKKWVSTIKYQQKYKKENYFPKRVNLRLRNFNNFYIKRRSLLKENIEKILRGN